MIRYDSCQNTFDSWLSSDICNCTLHFLNYVGEILMEEPQLRQLEFDVFIVQLSSRIFNFKKNPFMCIGTNIIGKNS